MILWWPFLRGKCVIYLRVILSFWDYFFWVIQQRKGCRWAAEARLSFYCLLFFVIFFYLQWIKTHPEQEVTLSRHRITFDKQRNRTANISFSYARVQLSNRWNARQQSWPAREGFRSDLAGQLQPSGLGRRGGFSPSPAGLPPARRACPGPALFTSGANWKIKSGISSLGQLEPKTVKSANILRMSTIWRDLVHRRDLVQDEKISRID